MSDSPIQQPNQQYTTPLAPWNVLSIVGFILSFFTAVIGLVLSIVALVQVNGAAKRGTPQRGKGLAVAGIIIGAVDIVLFWVVIAAAIAVNVANTN
jgi:hypothetical protein